MVASVQPIAGEFVKILAEGARQGATFFMIVERDPDLRISKPALDRAADIVTRDDGARFRIVTVHNWTTHKRGIPHRVATLMEIGDDA
jgi:predicted nucleic acid-binding protein